MNTRQSLPLSALRPIRRLFVALLLAGCSGGGTLGQQGFVEGFLGGVIADEPRAAIIGRDALSAGGSAADAAVTAYFAMAVTLPGAAGLGGGGACLVHDFEQAQTEALEFLARPPARLAADTADINVVPSNTRGMFALHARYGRLEWNELLEPAEQLARDGHAVSRAFVRELAWLDGATPVGPELVALLAPAPRGPLTEGDWLQQVELGATLSTLRRRGPGDFYGGQLGQNYVAAVASQGGSLTIEDLRDTRPRLFPTMQSPLGSNVMHFLPPPAVGGATAAQIWGMLADGRYDDATDGTRAHLLAEVSRRAYRDRLAWMRIDGTSDLAPQELIAPTRLQDLMRGYSGTARDPLDPPAPALAPAGGAGLLAVDRDGQVVACAFSMNRPFGTGTLIPGTGIVAAAPPDPEDPAPLAAMMLVNPATSNAFFGAVVTGRAAPAALVNVAAGSVLDNEPLAEALAAPRLYHAGTPDEVALEEAASPDIGAWLTQRGHRIRAVPRLGLVSAFACAEGLPRSNRCEFLGDPRGAGLAATADQ